MVKDLLHLRRGQGTRIVASIAELKKKNEGTRRVYRRLKCALCVLEQDFPKQQSR